VHRDHDDAQLGVTCAQPSRHLDAVGSRHRDIHQDHGRAELLDEPERLVAVPRLADDLVPTELQGDADGVAQHGVIIDDQDARPAVQDGLDPLPGRALQA
jgi:hypothetical protein